jgi:hypothetical protein
MPDRYTEPYISHDTRKYALTHSHMHIHTQISITAGGGQRGREELAVGKVKEVSFERLAEGSR